MVITLEGRRAIVTGGGKGIGRAHVIELARRGARVVVNDVDRQAADDVVGEVQQFGGAAVAEYSSVASPEGGRNIVQASVDAFGGLDIVIHNAGIQRPAYFEDMALEDIDSVLHTHLHGGIFVMQPAWSIMKRQRYGRVIMTSSGSGMLGNHAAAAYAAAKAGLFGLTKALTYEGEAFGIRVNAILPYARTTMPTFNPIPGIEEERAKFVSEEGLRKIAQAPLSTDTVARLAAYLVSDGCKFSGEAFSIMCGRFARVFVGVADGWMTPSEAEVTTEDIAEHIEEIRDISRHSVPRWIFEEYAQVAERLAPLPASRN